MNQCDVFQWTRPPSKLILRHSTAVLKLDFHNGRILKKTLLFINEFWKRFSMRSAGLRDLGPFFRKYPVNLEGLRLFSFPPVSTLWQLAIQRGKRG